MSSPYDILFEPVRIGPVTAPNRFYQVPHCNGFGYRSPRSHARMREIKALGGWGVICTEETEIHHTSDIAPFIEGRIWDDDDIPALALMTEAVHRHGALAGLELAYNGTDTPNLYSRAVSLGPRHTSVTGSSSSGFEPIHARKMDKQDIRNLRKWHRAAALRGKRAGFDVIYVYASHSMSIAMHFLMRRYNDRTDEYGGSLENRARLLRELIEDTKDAVGDTCAVAVRFSVDELLGDEGITAQGEGHDVVAMLAELPDLWDITLSDWDNDSATSRFEREGYQEPYMAFVKTLTTKPVVGVGRYTSPDTMVSLIKRGVMDFIGAARPSIADPFLPQKIREGRVEDIRECIGCNICVAADNKLIPIRCTQNPTMGEEWRRDWHPELIAPKTSDAEILIVGGGAAGLECARALGQRGYRVVLAEARNEFGGRVALESRLPGLNEWRRVKDWRMTQLKKMANVAMYPASAMTADDILEIGYQHVIVATGSQWRRDGVGRSTPHALPGHALPHVFTPDDLMADKIPTGRVVIFDDDHYYMGGVLAELLVKRGCAVTLVTAAPLVSYWTTHTLEQEKIEQRLYKLGVKLLTRHTLTAIEATRARVCEDISQNEFALECDAVVLLADRLPNDALYLELQPALEQNKIKSLRVIGDAEAPGILAQAVFAGHLAAREFDTAPVEGTPFRVERTAI
jgi:dimethylamine/trimethylamine dehydrogenase